MGGLVTSCTQPSFTRFLKSRLNPGGVLVTQSGQSGIKQHHLVFSPINRTLRDVFPTVLAYNQAVYSFLDEWGWNLAMAEKDANTKLSVEKVDQLIADRIDGELQFLDSVSWQGIFALSKKHRKTLEAETCVMSVAGT